MANKIRLGRGTKERIEKIKKDLLDYELVYSTDTNELVVKRADGDMEYFKSAEDIMIGVVTVMETELPLNGFKTIDGITVESKDRVLVTGLGKEHNGIYEVNEDGTWDLLQEVKPNQVVNVELGHEHGGSLQKKEHSGVTVVVKKPERSQWRVLI